MGVEVTFDPGPIPGPARADGLRRRAPAGAGPGRGDRLRAGRHPADSPGARGRRAAHRVRRRAVHDGRLPGRGRRIEAVRLDQGPAVRRARAGAPPARRLADTAGAYLAAQVTGGSRGGDALRHVGRAALAAGLRAFGQPSSVACSSRSGGPRPKRTRRTAHLLRGRRRRLAGPVPRPAGHTWSESTGGSTWTGRATCSARSWRCRETSTPPSCSGPRALIRERAHAVLGGGRPRRPRLQPGARHPARHPARPRRGARRERRGILPGEEPDERILCRTGAPGASRARRAGDDLAGVRRLVALIHRYDRPGPRYTSYPTAVEFSDAVRPRRLPWRSWTRPPRRPDPLSLYLHLPFCEERCTFCGCNVIITQEARGRGRPYLDYLHREIGDARPRRWTGAARSSSTTGAAARRPTCRPQQMRRAARHGRRSTSTSPLTPRSRSRSIRASRRASRSTPLQRARLQPPLDGRAGLHAGGPGGRQPQPDRASRPRALYEYCRAPRLHVDQLRPDLRPAAPDPRRPSGTRSSRCSPCGPTGWPSTPSPTSPGSRRQPEAIDPDDLPSPEREDASSSCMASELFREAGYQHDRHGPLRPARATSWRARHRERTAPPELHGLHGRAGARHGRLRRLARSAMSRAPTPRTRRSCRPTTRRSTPGRCPVERGLPPEPTTT